MQSAISSHHTSLHLRKFLTRNRLNMTSIKRWQPRLLSISWTVLMEQYLLMDKQAPVKPSQCRVVALAGRKEVSSQGFLLIFSRQSKNEGSWYNIQSTLATSKFIMSAGTTYSRGSTRVQILKSGQRSVSLRTNNKTFISKICQSTQFKMNKML